MIGYTAKVGLRKPGTWAWAVSQIRPADDWLPMWPAVREQMQRHYDASGRWYRGIAYDAGGLLPVVSQTFNASSEPEPVLTPEQAMTELIRMTEDMGLYELASFCTRCTSPVCVCGVER